MLGISFSKNCKQTFKYFHFLVAVFKINAYLILCKHFFVIRVNY
jgi:hypothetical protein